MRKLVICGAGGHGAEVQMIAEAINEESPRWELAGFFDPGYPKGSLVCGLPVLGDDDDLMKIDRPVDAVIAVGDTALRGKIFEALSRNRAISLPVLVHPRASVARSAILGEGSVIFPLAFISRDVTLGRAVLLNCAAQIGHHSRVGDYSILMPHAVVLGSVNVGSRVLLGANCTVLQGLTLGDDATVGMGSVALQHVSEGITVFGNPARVIARKKAI